MPDDSAQVSSLHTPAAGAHAPGRHRQAQPPRNLKLFGAALLFLAVASAAWGIVLRRENDRTLARWTDANAIPSVAVTAPLTGTTPRHLTLPGDVQAYYEAPIYARVSGYLQNWQQDIGAHVTAGQLLGVIDTPDLDQRLAQAEADLASAQANAALADLTAQRWHALLKTNSVSRQSADEKEGTARATRAMVKAQQAHVDQLRALKGFARLTAPFNGVVTARNTDVGALINAGTGDARPLFKVADVHAMRIYVRVPQIYLAELKPGLRATLTQPQYSGVTFAATLTTTSQSVTAESRTVLAELMAGNAAGKLWPGTYADVTFDLPPDRGVLRIPASALIFRARGTQVATVSKDNHIVMKPVHIGRNLGTQLEITDGLKPTDRVVVSPLDTLENGDPVHVEAARGG